MDEDIEAIIETSKHFKYHEPKDATLFNSISHLPESKRHLKMAIKKRMRLLAGALATFIDDDLVDLAENSNVETDKEKIKKIYETMLADIDKLTSEIEVFKVTELPTPEYTRLPKGFASSMWVWKQHKEDLWAWRQNKQAP